MIYSLIISLYIILLYSLLVFIINNEVVIVSVVNENIQVDFSDNDIPVVVGIIDVDVVSVVDNKVLVDDDDIIVDVGVQMIPII